MRVSFVFGPVEVWLDERWRAIGEGIPWARERTRVAVTLEEGPVGTLVEILEAGSGEAVRSQVLGPRVLRVEAPLTRDAVGAALRRAVANGLLPLGGFLVHAVAFDVEGKAHLFFGPSGAGKSTLARHSSLEVLGEESCVVWPEEARWWVAGTPWRSGGGWGGDFGARPLERVGYLAWGERLCFERRPASELLPRLLGATYEPSPTLSMNLAPELLRMLAAVERGRLSFAKESAYAG